MAEHSTIEWTDATWNPVTGCSIVSPGCAVCYAMKLAGTRLKHHPSRADLTVDTKAGPVWNGRIRVNEEWIDQPLRWKRPRMIFVCAHGDLFHEGVPEEVIDRVFAVMALTPQHTYQVLTKRAKRMREYLTRPMWSHHIAAATAWLPPSPSEIGFPHRPLPNVWLGVSAERQQEADQRIPDLLATPAAIRFVSAEPLLGPIDFTMIPTGGRIGDAELCEDALAGPPDMQEGERIDWVIVGGESGAGARPMHPAWARSIRDQCEDAGVPFFFKQWGEYGPAFDLNLRPTGLPWSGEAQRAVATGTATVQQATRRVGKRRAGRLLDGVEHNGMPEPQEVPAL